MKISRILVVILVLAAFSGCSGKGQQVATEAPAQAVPENRPLAAPENVPAAPAQAAPAGTQNTMREQTVCVEAACGSFKVKINADATGTVSDIAEPARQTEWPAAVSISGGHLYMAVSPPEGASRQRSLKFSAVLDEQKNVTFVGIVAGGSVYNPATIIRCP